MAIKLKNSKKVFCKKKDGDDDIPKGSYIVWQKKRNRYIYGHFKPIHTLFTPIERAANLAKDEDGHAVLPEMEKMIYLSDNNYQVLTAINTDDWEPCDMEFIANVEPIVKSAKKQDKVVIKKKVEWSTERVILLIVVIALCIVFIFFAYVIFYD